METGKNTPDLEQVIYELICYFKKWGMWEDTFIHCNGKAYIDVKLADLLEEDKGSIFYRHEKETGFRGLEDIAVCHGVNSDNLLDACCSYVSFGREKPLIILALGSVATGLVQYGEYEACYKDLAAEAKRFLLANTWLGECILDNMRQEIEDLREELDEDWILQDFDSYEEWKEEFSSFTTVEDVFPKGAWLDLDHPEIYDDWVGFNKKGQIVDMDDEHLFYATHPDEGKDVESHLLHELNELLHKYGLEYEPERGWLISIHKQQ